MTKNKVLQFDDFVVKYLIDIRVSKKAYSPVNGRQHSALRSSILGLEERPSPVDEFAPALVCRFHLPGGAGPGCTEPPEE